MTISNSLITSIHTSHCAVDRVRSVLKMFKAKRGVALSLRSQNFGSYQDPVTSEEKTVTLFTWRNSKRTEVNLINYGATIVSITTADKAGELADIVTGFNDVEGYRNPANRYFGATIGRYANRIGHGKVTGKDTDKDNNNKLETGFELSKNNLGKHHLHGGFKGFDKVLWEYHIDNHKVVLSYHAKDGEEGYPGDLVVHAIFELTVENEFLIDYKATTTKSTVMNMTNHSYFNLAGCLKGAGALYEHRVNLNADSITEVDSEGIPTGEILHVGDTVFDFRTPKVLGDVIHAVPNRNGFDHNFCVNPAGDGSKTFVARVHHPKSGRVLEVYSNQPGVQFYTANFLPDRPENWKGDPADLITISGKGGAFYKHGAFCLEPQIWPDAPNHNNFPNATLLPGQIYHHQIAYKFSALACLNNK